MFDSLTQAIMILGILLIVTGGIFFISQPRDKKESDDNDSGRCSTPETCRCC